MRSSLFKRLLFVTLLALVAAFSLAAQEGEAKQSGEKAEPSAALKWANFAILAAGLGYLVAKTFPPMFKTRNEEIQKGITEAQAVKKDAERRAAEVEARMQTLGKEIEKLRAESKLEMQQESEHIRQETARHISRIEMQAEQEIDSAAKVARRDLKVYAAQLAMDLAEQRVRAKLDAQTESTVFDAYIQDLQQQPGKEARN